MSECVGVQNYRIRIPEYTVERESVQNVHAELFAAVIAGVIAAVIAAVITAIVAVVCSALCLSGEGRNITDH
jgi:hypothetical protein